MSLTSEIKIEGAEQLQSKLSKDKLLGPAIRKLLDRAGHAVERRASMYSPVDTGRLKSSWTTKTDVARVPTFTKVGTNVRYAKPLEERRYTTRGKRITPRGVGRIPFFAPAVSDSKRDIEMALAEATKMIEDTWRS